MRRVGRLEIISFIVGFSLLTFELVAARILAPSIGSSTYVWTSVIGVIIAALAVGFWVGGKLADRRDHATDVVWLLGLAGLTVAVTKLMYPAVLNDTVAGGFEDIRLQGVQAALLLFAPTSFLIGVIGPYLAKLNIRSLHTSGQHVASLDAFNAVGGIVGTFLTGFVLFGFVGSRETLVFVTALLLVASWLLKPRYRTVQRLVFCGAVLMIVGLPTNADPDIVSIDTPSAHYQVRDFVFNGRPVTGLTTGPTGIQSATYSDGSNELVFWYTREIARLALEQQPKRVLILGGGAFTLPQYLAEKLLASRIDVVEIDPELRTISERYFHYKNPANVRHVFHDARTFVNQTRQTYDLVVVDVYGDTSIPFSLLTQEYTAALERIIAPNGRVLTNIIAGLNGPCLELFEAIHAAYRKEFAFAYYSTESEDRRANFIVLYSRSPQDVSGMKSLRLKVVQPPTDNYAPAERWHYSCQQTS